MTDNNSVRVIIDLPPGFADLIAEKTAQLLADRLVEKISCSDITFKTRLPARTSFADIIEEVKVLFSPGRWFTIEEYKLRAGITRYETAVQRLLKLARKGFLDKKTGEGRGSPVSYCLPYGKEIDELDRVLQANKRQQLQQMREGY